MQEPIEYFFNNYKYDKNHISEIITGSRYLAVKNQNGQIGVCATLGNIIEINNEILDNPNLKILSHRIFLTAYYNSILNYEKNNYSNGDLMEIINFTNYKKIAMVGYFRPIVEKMNKLNIKVDIFDLRDKEISLPINEQKKYLKQCDAAIVSATSVYNLTFSDIVNNCNGEIFILGPSSTMNDYLLNFNNVKAIFGSVFKNNDSKVLEIIKNNLGTRHFLKLGEKKVLINNLNNS